MFAAGFGGHQDFLIGDARWGRLVCNKRRFRMVDDTIDHREICEEGNDAHPTAALGTEHGVDFIDFLTIGRRKPYSRWNLLSYSAGNRSK